MHGFHAPGVARHLLSTPSIPSFYWRHANPQTEIKWFKPAKGQFQIYYRQGADHLEYQPDFVAETADTIYMLEPKASNQMDNLVVLAKRDAAIKWCAHATTHAKSHGGKPWRYVLIPHDVIAENMTLNGLAKRYGVTD